LAVTFLFNSSERATLGGVPFVLHVGRLML